MNQDDLLNSLHTTTAVELDTVLDVEAGLREALVAAQHTRTGSDLDLDVEAGLHAIVPTAERSTPPTPTPPANTEQPDITRNTPELRGAVANWLMSLDSTHRLAMRQHPVIIALALTLEIANAAALARLASARGGASVSDRARARTRTRELALVRALVRARALVRDLDRARDRVRDLDLGDLERVLDLAREFVSTRARLIDIDPDLASDLASDFDIDPDLASILAGALDRASTLTGALDRVLDGAVDVDVDVDRAGTLDLARVHYLARDLDRARHDFTTADLRSVDLSQVSLTGIRWSMATKWPSDEWRNQAVLDSQEVGDGVYQIRGGTTTVNTHSG